MIVHKDIIQGTPEWLNLRVGLVTMSCLDKIITPAKGEVSKSQDGYMNQLLAELYYGHPLDGFQSQAMANGVEFEAESVATFEFLNDCTTEKIGFVTNDAGTIGCSPDRFIVERDRDMLECKCPEAHTHMGYLRTKKLDAEYRCQLQGELWICEKDKVIVTSYNRRMPFVQIEVGRDDAFIARAEIYVAEFLERFQAEKARFGLPDRVS